MLRPRRLRALAKYTGTVQSKIIQKYRISYILFFTGLRPEKDFARSSGSSVSLSSLPLRGRSECCLNYRHGPADSRAGLAPCCDAREGILDLELLVYKTRSQ